LGVLSTELGGRDFCPLLLITDDVWKRKTTLVPVF
jgi:hypothetical protein